MPRRPLPLIRQRLMQVLFVFRNPKASGNRDTLTCESEDYLAELGPYSLYYHKSIFMGAVRPNE
jgi:hypothetical protein